MQYDAATGKRIKEPFNRTYHRGRSGVINAMLRIIYKESDLPLDKDPVYKAEFRKRFIEAHNKRIKRLKAQGKHYSQQKTN